MTSLQKGRFFRGMWICATCRVGIWMERSVNRWTLCVSGVTCCIMLQLNPASAAAPDTLAAKEPVHLVQAIPLPGVTGRIDHMAVDVKRERLFVVALGNNSVEVLDLRSGTGTHSITSLHEPQGIAYIPDSNRICVSNGGDGACVFFDCASFRRVREFSLTDDADNVRYDPIRGRLYVGYGSGGLAMISAAGGSVLGRTPLSGHPEAFQIDRSGARAYVNIPASNEIAVVSLDSQAVVAKLVIREAHSNYPLALDEGAGRLYIGCRTPPVLLTYDLTSGLLLSQTDIAGDVDDIFVDTARRRLYLSCGAGFLQVLQEGGDGHLATVAKIPTRQGARTCLFVPELNRLYVAAPRHGSRDAEVEVFSVQP
jgi:hypothetical protein